MSQVQQVKDATDIVQLISERVKLTRSGSSYKGLCPFHSEKSPSFFVSEQIQRYRCFGCGETGDVYDFLQKYDGLTFAESLQHLADRAGIKLKDYQRTPEDDLRERLLEILSLTKEYYHYLLTDHKQGEPARKYLADRKINSASIELFQLGFAPGGWDGLIKYLHHKKKYSLDDLQQAGLIIRGSGGRFYDRFRGRVMFPLKDHRGRVVGFSGRLLDAKPKEAKYINSPETLLYHKSKLLYGFKELLSEIQKQEAVIVVEGEFDVVSSAQNHINHIVAIKGSALTSEQVKLIARVAKKIILSLDADSAGVEATRRAIEVVGDTDIELRVIDLSALESGQKDVDELARNDPQTWRKISQETLSVYEFLLRLSLRHNDPQTPEGKRGIVKEIGLIFDQIPHAVERDFYLKKLAKILQVQVSVILQDARRFGSKWATGRADRKTDEKTPEKVELTGRREKLENYLLFLLFEGEGFSQKLVSLQEFSFATSGFDKLLSQFVKKAGDATTPPDLKSLAAGLAEDLKQTLFDAIYTPEFLELKETIKPEKEWQQTLAAFKREVSQEQIKNLQEQISELEGQEKLSSTEEEQLATYLRQVVKLQNQQR
ncbi:MAG: DNA primase [Candidatus Paceibacterota bacterium]